MTAAATLPEAFRDLERFADWILPDETARFDKRIASSMLDIQAFYDAAMARFEDAADYLELQPLDTIADDAKNLLWLYCAFVTISFAVECWRQPTVPDSGASSFNEVVGPAV